MDLELAEVVGAVSFSFGGIHFESLSHLSSFLVGLAALGDVGAFGGFIHLDMSVDVDASDGHCHDAGGGGGGAGTRQFCSLADLGVGVRVAVVDFLGFNTTLLGQDNLSPAGILDLYLGVDDVFLLSEELFESLL